MRWFKPEFPVVDVTCDPDGHINLNRLAILGTPAHSTCESGRERQREFKLCDIAVCTARHSKDFCKRAVELVDTPDTIGVERHHEKYLTLFNRTDLKQKRVAR
jgi:hypothetical protein